ncbi:hypothetical protein CDL15_Pgr000123 [Punica granatum]|uniref:MLO-like protein n=1 Tax=Punica granatum TaxID=22663 RepID=A0A218Y252_PUNGR|nr:hypothetical protein CDL15_Pgr000123 [Punica granatum]
MATEEEAIERTLEETPTWAVATVCFVLIFTSIFLEHLIHLLSKYFRRSRRRSLIHALDKIKSELMLLGFISLLLTVGEKTIANICIPKSVGETFLPCSSLESDDTEEETKCQNQGKVSLLSREGVQELQYLIFVLAFFHSLSCILTFALGMAKMRKWESWEAETRTVEYQFSNDPRRFKLVHQTSFGKRHLRFWSDHPILQWPASFLRQFFNSVPKVDYLTLRHGFIMVHLSEGSNFDFQKYIKRALEKDFSVLVGIRPKLLLYLIHFILFQNSFQLAFFTWSWFKYGFRSCFHQETEDIVIRLVMGVAVQVLCGYVTLPLYALVTQMGTSMRQAVFPENVHKGLKRWRATARKNLALRNPYSAGPSLDASVDTSLGTSPSFYTLDVSIDTSLRNSPSFNTLDVSLAMDLINPEPDPELLQAVDNVGNEAPNGGDHHENQMKNKGSFDDFVTN